MMNGSINQSRGGGGHFPHDDRMAKKQTQFFLFFRHWNDERPAFAIFLNHIFSSAICDLVS